LGVALNWKVERYVCGERDEAGQSGCGEPAGAIAQEEGGTP